LLYLYNFHCISTYFEIPFLNSLNDEKKLNISIEVVKDQELLIPEIFKKKEIGIVANLDKVIIFYKNLAYFEIFRNGEIIKVKELFSKKKKNLFLSKFINHVLPYALYQKRKLVLHSSGISKNGEAVIFLGKSGTGKSSLSASFKDCNFLSEDSTLINFEPRNCYVSPGLPLVKLTKNIAKRLEFSEKDKISLPGDRLSRSYYRTSKNKDKKIILKKCYVLAWGSKFEIIKVNSKDFLANFLSSTYSSYPYNSCKESMKIKHKFASDFFSLVPTYKIIRNKRNFFEDNKEIWHHCDFPN
tara:strand:+ start:2953 stop:3849 length:897 start_codon:yes stop_codon:yes gene_type:complete